MVATSWKRLMDKEKGSWRESVDGALAKTSSAPAETQFGTVTPEKLAAPSASLADEMHLSGGSPSSTARFLRAGRYYQKLLLQSSQVIDKVEI